ncbi:MAG: hypothetical protein H7836_08825 [Magnetococcus sp. YQC-3]
MAEISADLQIQFASHAADAPFELVVENTDQKGDVPVHVDYISDLIIFMQSYNIDTKNMNDIRFEPLKKMLQPGRKRIKLYCPLADLPHIWIFVDNGEKKYSHIEVMQQWTKSPGSNVGVFGFTFGSVPMPHFVAEYTSTVVTNHSLCPNSITYSGVNPMGSTFPIAPSMRRQGPQVSCRPLEPNRVAV